MEKKKKFTADSQSHICHIIRSYTQHFKWADKDYYSPCKKLKIKKIKKKSVQHYHPVIYIEIYRVSVSTYFLIIQL